MVVAECKVIEQYLARKHGFLGKNSYEHTLVNSFVSSTGGLWDDLLFGTLNVQVSAEMKQEIIAGFVSKKIPNWIRIHEQHLAANGRNGHYVGDQVKEDETMPLRGKTSMTINKPMVGLIYTSPFPTAETIISLSLSVFLSIPFFLSGYVGRPPH